MRAGLGPAARTGRKDAGLRTHLAIAAVLLLTAYGQLMTKSRAIAHAGASESQQPWRYLFAMFTDPWVLSGLVAAFAASGLWMVAVRESELGYAYPFMALSFVLVPVAASFLFREPLPPLQFVGLALVVAGVTISALAR